MRNVGSRLRRRLASCCASPDLPLKAALAVANIMLGSQFRATLHRPASPLRRFLITALDEMDVSLHRSAFARSGGREGLSGSPGCCAQAPLQVGLTRGELNPLQCQPRAMFGSMASALSISSAPFSVSPASIANANPAEQRATASSLARTLARRARRSPSARSVARSTIQPLAFRRA